MGFGRWMAHGYGLCENEQDHANRMSRESGQLCGPTNRHKESSEPITTAEKCLQTIFAILVIIGIFVAFWAAWTTDTALDKMIR